MVRDLSSPKRPRVALLIESSRAYGRGLLTGIGRYVREHGPWDLDIEERTIDDGPSWFGEWSGDGVIARVESRELDDALRRTRTPAVDVRGTHDVNMPVIDTDNCAVAAVAADHLIQRGFRSFAFCGYGGLNYSRLRKEAFEAFLRKRGLEVSIYESAARQRSRLRDLEQQGLSVEASLVSWLESLPKPVGIMACNDIRGQQVIRACRTVDIPVPEAVGLVGVDNDEILCELSNPSLSSVTPDVHRIGYEAARLLHRMMRTGNRSKERVLIPPIGIEARESTSSPAIGDAAVAHALCLIRNRVNDPLSIDDLARSVSLTRRTLERRFLNLVGRSPNAEIQRVRLERVAELLRTTDWNLSRVAENAGFAHTEYMSTLFKNKRGETPGAYRTRARDSAS
ncbi:MAG: XylR family transcriptional regulator [Planctomycetota bacterium]